MANAFPVRFEPTHEQVMAEFKARQQARAHGWDYTEFSRDPMTWATWVRESGSVTYKAIGDGYFPMVPRHYVAAVDSKEVMS